MENAGGVSSGVSGRNCENKKRRNPNFLRKVGVLHCVVFCIINDQVAGRDMYGGEGCFADFVEIVNISYCGEKLIVIKYLMESYFYVCMFGYSVIDDVWGHQINTDERYECLTKR